MIVRVRRSSLAARLGTPGSGGGSACLLSCSSGGASIRVRGVRGCRRVSESSPARRRDDPVRVSANDLAADHDAVAGGQAVRPWARGRVASARHAASTSLLSPASLTSSGWRSCSCCRRFAARSARSASWHESGESFSEEQAGPSVRRIQSAADSGAPHFETESDTTCIPALHTRS